MKAALYIRVSTADQNADLQTRELQTFAADRGWTVTHTYNEIASGASHTRPQQKQLMDAARRREFDAVLVWKLDRFGRSMIDVVEKIRQLDACRVRFVAAAQNIDSDQQTNEGRLLLHILAAFSEFEREMIRDRSRAGRTRYEQDLAAGRVGKQVHSKSGKDMPPHRPRKIFDRERARQLYQEHRSIRAVATLMGVARTTIERSLKQ